MVAGIIAIIVVLLIILLLVYFDVFKKIGRHFKLSSRDNYNDNPTNVQSKVQPQKTELEDSDTRVNESGLTLGGYEDAQSTNLDEETKDTNENNEWDFNFENEADFNKFISNISEQDLDKQLQKFNDMFSNGEYEEFDEDDDSYSDVVIDSDDVIIGKYSGLVVDEDEDGVLSEDDEQALYERNREKPSLYEMYNELPKEMKVLFLTDIIKNCKEEIDN